MTINFSKYEGAGNDFILIDNRLGEFDNLTNHQMAAICHRRFGVGADGLMLLGTANGFDFSMRYFNADGGESTMCGNGGRCITRFADDLGIGGSTKRFTAIDGEHTATINADQTISLAMIDVCSIEQTDEGYLLNTGSPHLVVIDEPYNQERARELRHQFNANINFISFNADGSLNIRTFERGVEDETLACGTGATAAAIIAHATKHNTENQEINARGGNLSVNFEFRNGIYQHIILCGGARKVFDGVLSNQKKFI